MLKLGVIRRNMKDPRQDLVRKGRWKVEPHGLAFLRQTARHRGTLEGDPALWC